MSRARLSLAEIDSLPIPPFDSASLARPSSPVNEADIPAIAFQAAAAAPRPLSIAPSAAQRNRIPLPDNFAVPAPKPRSRILGVTRGTQQTKRNAAITLEEIKDKAQVKTSPWHLFLTLASKHYTALFRASSHPLLYIAYCKRVAASQLPDTYVRWHSKIEPECKRLQSEAYDRWSTEMNLRENMSISQLREHYLDRQAKKKLKHIHQGAPIDSWIERRPTSYVKAKRKSPESSEDDDDDDSVRESPSRKRARVESQPKAMLSSKKMIVLRHTALWPEVMQLIRAKLRDLREAFDLYVEDEFEDLVGNDQHYLDDVRRINLRAEPVLFDKFYLYFNRSNVSLADSVNDIFSVETREWPDSRYLVSDTYRKRWKRVMAKILRANLEEIDSAVNEDALAAQMDARLEAAVQALQPLSLYAAADSTSTASPSSTRSRALAFDRSGMLTVADPPYRSSAAAVSSSSAFAGFPLPTLPSAANAPSASSRLLSSMASTMSSQRNTMARRGNQSSVLDALLRGENSIMRILSQPAPAAIGNLDANEFTDSQLDEIAIDDLNQLDETNIPQAGIQNSMGSVMNPRFDASVSSSMNALYPNTGFEEPTSSSSGQNPVSNLFSSDYRQF